MAKPAPCRAAIMPPSLPIVASIYYNRDYTSSREARTCKGVRPLGSTMRVQLTHQSKGSDPLVTWGEGPPNHPFGHRIICVQRNWAMDFAEPSAVTIASQTCVVRP
jgi:hypothetical protein